MSSQPKLETIVDPYVIAAILDHVSRSKDANGKMRARGWLIGSFTHKGSHVTNFMPDTDNRPHPTASKVQHDEYGAALSGWTAAMKHHAPKDSTIIGFYAVGNGENITYEGFNVGEGGEAEVLVIPYEKWATTYSRTPYFQRAGRAVFLDVRIPFENRHSVDITGKQYSYSVENERAVIADVEADVIITPESAATNTVMDAIVRQAYGEDEAETVVPALNIDRILHQLPSGENASEKIKAIAAQLHEAIVTAKSVVAGTAKGDMAKSSEIVKAFEAFEAELPNADASDTRVQNALMIKYVVSLIQTQIQQLEINIKNNYGKKPMPGMQRFTSDTR